MDFGTTLKHLAPFAVPLLALCIPIFAIVMRSLERMRRNNNLHATLRHLSERGTPIPPELLEAAIRDQTPSQKPWTNASQLRAGIINVAIGLGLMLLFAAMRPDEDWLWVIGAIPAMIGLGFLLIWRIETRQQRS
jgi:hypothetical protein